MHEFCKYNLKNPHKNMWELKPEYRHYKSDEAAEGGSAGLVVILYFLFIFSSVKKYLFYYNLLVTRRQYLSWTVDCGTRENSIDHT